MLILPFLVIPLNTLSDMLAFDGATKRNRPALKVGSLVYARVSVANKFMDPELSCTMDHGPKKDWMTGESVYGELKSGFVFKANLALCRRYLDSCLSTF